MAFSVFGLQIIHVPRGGLATLTESLVFGPTKSPTFWSLQAYNYTQRPAVLPKEAILKAREGQPPKLGMISSQPISTNGAALREGIIGKLRTPLSVGSKSRSPSPDPQPGSSRQVVQTVIIEAITTPFTEFLANELKDDYHKLVAMSFAVYIKDDTEAQIIDLDDITHFLGYKQKVKAVELLLKNFPETTPISADTGDDDEFTRVG